MTSPSILRPLRSSTSSNFYSATYRNSQVEPATSTSTSSATSTATSVGFNDSSPATYSNNGKNKKQSHAFATSSSGAFSSRSGLLSNPNNNSTQKLTGFGSGSGTSSFGTPGDSALKDSATQATSVYFADKHQEINLPPKFVKQMAKLEKERIKLFEKEKVKVNKLLNSALKVTNSAMKSSSSNTTLTSHIKNQNSNQLRNEDYDYDNINVYNNEKKSYLNDDDRSVKLAAALCLDREGDRDIGGKSLEKDRGRERGREKGRDRDEDDEEKNNVLTARHVPQLNNQYESNFTDEKKNKRLGKLGKITKSVRAYGSGDDNAPQASTSTSTSTSVGERMIGTTTSAISDMRTSSAPTSTSTSTSTSTPITVNLSDMRSIVSNQDINKKNNSNSNSKNSLDHPSLTGTPGHSQITPPESQMAMLMCAMGSHLGTLGAEIPIQDVEPVRVPNKVGRPKLSYKEKVCMLC